jgi:hypothetical protein
VLHRADGSYGLVEFKLGDCGIDEGAAHLTEMKGLIQKANDEKQARLRLPSFLMVLTGTDIGYRRDDGVYVVPIGCLGE